MSTSIEIRSQIKAVIISLGGVIFSGVLILAVVPLVFDYPTVVAGVGPISGGIIALLITSDKLTEIGMSSLLIIPTLFGFPGDYILCDEVSRSIGRDEEEVKVIFDELLAPMLIGGFTTLTVTSVVIAGILV